MIGDDSGTARTKDITVDLTTIGSIGGTSRIIIGSSVGGVNRTTGTTAGATTTGAGVTTKRHFDIVSG